MQFVQFLINGLMSGAIYALIAIGIVAVYKSTRVVNFAHGYMIMIGAYLYYTFAVLFPELSWAPSWLSGWTPEWVIEGKNNAKMFSPEAAFYDWIPNIPTDHFWTDFCDYRIGHHRLVHRAFFDAPSSWSIKFLYDHGDRRTYFRFVRF